MAERSEMSRTIADSQMAEFTNVSTRSRRILKSLICAQLAHYFCCVPVLAVDGFVHGTHVVRGDAAGERLQCSPDLGPASEGFVAHQGDGLVRREIVAVVFES